MNRKKGKQQKNKKEKYRHDGSYRQLRNTLFLRTTLLLITDAVLLFIFSDLFLFGRFANFMVGILNRFIYHDYDRALETYQRLFRNRLEWFWLMGLFVIFLVSMWIYLRNFTKYFYEINRGIDALIEENQGEVILSPELSLTERKINHIRHTLEQRKSEAAVAEQRKNDLVVYLAHDLKTPLTSVIGYLTLLRDEGQISEELREKYLSISLSKAERLEDLINEFLEIAKYNLSTITLQYGQINLTRLLEQLVFEFQPILEKKGLTCRLAAAEDMMLNCDAGKLQRVFDNLLRNAAAYSYDQTEITVEAQSRGGEIILRFSNHGGTIPKEKLERIFEQFYRLDPGRGAGGAGLGLAIVKQIIALHKGTITAASENGLTVFTVTLPAL